MHGYTNAKFINAKQAKGIYLYRNIKRKLYRTIAAIWSICYNKTCMHKQLAPNYIAIKINGKNQQCANTQWTISEAVYTVKCF